MELKIQNVSMTYPSGKQALKGLNLDLKSPSLRPAGPQRGGQVHPDETAGGSSDAH